MHETESHYDTFLQGELIDLVIPNQRAIHVDGWHNWFNDNGITRYMRQGMYPMSTQRQEAFLHELTATESPSRIALLIKPKEMDAVVGVASISHIDHVSRQGDFAMVVAQRTKKLKSAFFGMEAKCLLTEHAFEVLGLERINSTQAAPLKDWQRWQILFGYKMEGILRKAFRKGYTSYDVMTSSCLLEDYLALKELRGGSLWPGYKGMIDLMRDLPSQTLEEKLSKTIQQTVSEHYNSIRMV